MAPHRCLQTKSADSDAIMILGPNTSSTLIQVENLCAMHDMQLECLPCSIGRRTAAAKYKSQEIDWTAREKGRKRGEGGGQDIMGWMACHPALARLHGCLLGCQVCVEIFAQTPPETGPKVAQLALSSEFTVFSIIIDSL